MKTIVSTVKSLIIIVLAMMVVSCSKKSKIEVIADVANRECPVTQGEMIISQIDYDKDEKNLVYHIVCTNDSFDITKFQNNSILNNTLALTLSNSQDEDTKALIDALIESNSGMKYVYYSADKKDKVECVISIDEIKAISNIDDVDSKAEKILNDVAQRVNSDFPTQLDNITKALNLEKNDTAMVYHFVIQADDIEDVRQRFNTTLLRTNIMLGLIDVTNRAFVLSCVKTNRSIVYSYKFDGIDNDATITFTPADLQRLVLEKQ